jgi:hypothetical protein
MATRGKLTQAQADDIRRATRRSTSDYTIAHRFGVSATIVAAIRTGKAYKPRPASARPKRPAKPTPRGKAQLQRSLHTPTPRPALDLSSDPAVQAYREEKRRAAKRRAKRDGAVLAAAMQAYAAAVAATERRSAGRRQVAA